MSELILHHYPSSPFSEKIRLVLGYKGLAWQSVLIPSMLPKPDLQMLTGGYRRAPVLQVGADIYCDTALICDVLEHAAPEPTLYPPHAKGVARILAQWADTTLFWTAMAYNTQPRGLAEMFAGLPPEAAKAFGQDRAAMSVGMTRLRPSDATAAYRSYLRRLANMLEEHPFLLGPAPCIADFAAFHPLWFTQHRVPSLAGIFDATPVIGEWMARMQAIGHGTMHKLGAAESIALAAKAEPLPVAASEPFQDDHGIALGTQVSITAESFGLEATHGELIAATRMHFSLRRIDESLGTVHVHFPRIGYMLRKLEA
ncbi:glutathione S-transferase [Rhodoferax koreense]|uniref:Glutathione S-transferase n=1 Tax=Rhodoferax koreensis TaxID=1842727 RepID=A0A1P8JWT2_9BURK|nr:glutathione S-transferase family protein [Rhodoferax koreense]APW38188.1 glutathione S-transferase [Rhodoferax koreense]